MISLSGVDLDVILVLQAFPLGELLTGVFNWKNKSFSWAIALVQHGPGQVLPVEEAADSADELGLGWMVLVAVSDEVLCTGTAQSHQDTDVGHVSPLVPHLQVVRRLAQVARSDGGPVDVPGPVDPSEA